MQASTIVSVRRPLDEARPALRNERVGDRHALELGLCELRKPRRADERDVAAVGEAGSAHGYIRGSPCRRAEHRDALADRAGAGRLDREHGADEGHGIGRAQMREDEGRGGVAGDDDEVGAVGRDQLAHERDDARDGLALAAAVVGKEGVVGDVDVARVGSLLATSRNREAPSPNQRKNGRRSRHAAAWYGNERPQRREECEPPHSSPAQKWCTQPMRAYFYVRNLPNGGFAAASPSWRDP